MTQLQKVTFQTHIPTAGRQVASFFLGNDEAEPSGQWISGQVETRQSGMKSLALNQLSVLHAARELIDAEIERMTGLYEQAEQSPR